MARSRDNSATRSAPDLVALSQEFKSIQSTAAGIFPELARTGTEFRSPKEACQALVMYLKTVVVKLGDTRKLVEGKDTASECIRLRNNLQDSNQKLVEAKEAILTITKEKEALGKQLAAAKRSQSISDTVLTGDTSLQDRDKEILKLKSKVRSLTSKVSTANEDYWRSKAQKYKAQVVTLQAEPVLQVYQFEDYLDLIQVQAKALEGALQPTGTADLHSEEKIVQLSAQLADMTEGESQLHQLIQQLDQQNKDLYASLTTKDRETVFLQEQIKRLQRESTPKKTSKQVYLTPKKRASYEKINDLVSGGDLVQAAVEWKEEDYLPLQNETMERNFELLRNILKLRDKEHANLQTDAKTKEVDWKLAEQKLQTVISEKEGEIRLLKDTLGAGEGPEIADDQAKQKIQNMEETIRNKDQHISILVDQCESLNEQISLLRGQNEELEGKLRNPGVSRGVEEALLAKNREVETLVRQCAEAKGQVETLNAQVRRLEDQTLAVKSSAQQAAYIARLETELKVLRGGVTGDGLRELVQRVVTRSERTMEGMEKEIRDLQTQVELKVAERVGKQMEAMGEWTAQEAQLKAYVQRLERDGQMMQSAMDALQLENSRLQSLFEEERKAHAATLKLMQGGNPSLMELEQQREDYLVSIQNSFSTQIRKLSDRMDALQREIIQKNSEVKDLEAKYTRDTTDLADKLKDEHSRKLEIASLFKDSKCEVDSCKEEISRLKQLLEHQDLRFSHTQSDKLRQAEDAVLQQNSHISDLEHALQTKENALNASKEQVNTLKRQLEDMERAVAMLRNQVEDGNRKEHNRRFGSDGLEQELRRFEADNLRLRTEIESMRMEISGKREEKLSFKDRNSQIDLLSDTIAAKDKEIASIRVLMEKYRSQLDLRNTGKTNEIQSLTAQLEEKTSFVKQLNAELEGLSQDLKKVKEERSKALEEVNKLQRLLGSVVEWVEGEAGSWQAMGLKLPRVRRTEDAADRVNTVKKTLTAVIEAWKDALKVDPPQEMQPTALEASNSAVTVSQLLSSNLQLEKELLGKSQSVLRDDALLKTLLASKGSGSDMAGRLALQRWQEAEQEVYKLRARLVEVTGRLEKAYSEDRKEEIQTLRRKLEEGTAQIMALQSTVQSLQEARRTTDPGPPIRVESLKPTASNKGLEDTLNKVQAEARKSASQVQRLQEEMQRKEETLKQAVEKLIAQLRQMPRVSESLTMTADPLVALEQVGAQLWTWTRLTQFELERKTEEGNRRKDSQELTELHRKIQTLESEKTALANRCEQLKAELRSAKTELEAKVTAPRKRETYDVDLYERGRLIGINEGKKEKDEQFEVEKVRLQQVAKRYSDSLEEMQRQFQVLQEKYIALMKEPRGSRGDTDEVSRLRREKEELQTQYLRKEAEWKEVLRRKEEEAKAGRTVTTPIRSASPARREDAIKLELLNRRSAALREIQDCERSNRVVDPAMRAYVRELNAALTKYP